MLIGDAAHGMIPHASQGRMQAMVDAVTLADIIETCQVEGDWSCSALQVFEDRRRPQVTMLQRLADEEGVLLGIQEIPGLSGPSQSGISNDGSKSSFAVSNLNGHRRVARKPAFWVVRSAPSRRVLA